MEKSKLVLVLKSLDQEELRVFKLFLTSKLVNQHEQVEALFDYLRSQLKVRKPDFSKKKIFELLFGNKPYKDKPIRNLMSYLLKRLERFLIHQEMHQKKNAELLALCQSYRKRNLHKLFDQTVRQAEEMLAKSASRDVQYHQWNYELEKEKYNALTQQKRASANNLQVVSDRLDISYFADRLRQSCVMLAHQTVYSTSYDLGIVSLVVQEVEKRELQHVPAIGIYYYLYLAQINEDNIAFFKQMQHTLIASVQLFEKDEMRDIYLLAINIAIKNINKGRLELMHELLALYQSGIEQGVFITNEVLSRFTFKNIVAVALRLRKFEWVEQFIKTYKMNVEAPYREVTYSYNLARMHSTKKEYAKALKLLAVTALSDDVYINLDTKILLSRIYYEQNELDALELVIQSFKAYIQRKKMIGYQRSIYQNFISSINKLVSLNPYDRVAKKALLEEIEATPLLADKYWFLEQLA